jgi:hypothetical protein
MNDIARLQSAADAFVASIQALPEHLFLTLIDDWTPRDIAAHLAWWNNNMLVACKDLQKGRAPSYWADALNDYRTINAQAIAQFSAQEQRVLLAQLKSTLFEFKEYLASLDAKDWDAECGIQHPRGGAATISRIVESLISDYEAHTKQIEDWVGKQPPNHAETS